MFFGLIPTFMSLLLKYLSNVQIEPSDFIGEILFFTIMTSSVSLSDMVGINKTVRDFLLTIFNGVFILLVITASTLYGVFAFGQLNYGITEIFNLRAFNLSLTFAIISGTLGTIIQIYLSKAKE